MSVRARKVFLDIWQNKSRTLLVVASIAIGLMALSTTFRAQAIFQQNLAAELTAVNQASATLLTTPVNDEIVESISEIDGVEIAEGRLIIPSRIQIGAEWRPLRLEVLLDDELRAIDKIFSESGEWPPAERAILLERSSVETVGVVEGDGVMIELPMGGEKRLSMMGTVHDLNIMSGRVIDQMIYGYISEETAVWLGIPVQSRAIKIVTSDGRNDVERITAVAEEARDKIESQRATVLGWHIPKPNTHILDNVIQSLLLILGSLGILSLLLSAFLVFNTVSALLARQIPQIGIMKAIGAPRRDIVMMYLVTILIFSGLSVIVAVPLGMLGARVMTQMLGFMMNFDVTDFQVPTYVPFLEIGMGLLVPLVAASVPVWNGTRISVREALDARSGGANFGSGAIDRLLARMRGLPSTLSYAARNIFRQKLRLFLTLFTLSMGGAIFITVLSVRASLFMTIEQISSYWQQDVMVDFQRPYRLDHIQNELVGVDGVADSEGWLIDRAFYVRPDGTDGSEPFFVFALPYDSQFVEPTLIDGRWLNGDDTNAIVVNIDLTTREPSIAVGDMILVRSRGREMDMEVVGLVTPQLIGAGEPRPENAIGYVPYDYFAEESGRFGEVTRLTVKGVDVTPAGQRELSYQINDQFRGRGIQIRLTETNANSRQMAEDLTMPALLLLLSMAFLFALVGGLGLTSTMSLNVLERTAEIGIIRSIGGTSSTIMQIVVVEGVFVGLLSWVIAALLAYPTGWMMSVMVGVSFIKVPLVYQFAPEGILIWLGIVVVLAVIASYLPARNASRLVVREALAYE